MGQVLAAVGAVGVGRIGEPLVRPQADERRVDEPHGGIAHRRRVDGVAAADKPAALHEVIALLQFCDKLGHVLDGVLVVAVDGQDAFIIAVQRKIHAHAQLGALPAGAGFRQQRVDVVERQRLPLHAAVGGAAVADDDVAELVDARLLGAAQLGQDARTLVDDGDQQAVVMAAALKLHSRVVGHAVQVCALILDHANTSAI